MFIFNLIPPSPILLCHVACKASTLSHRLSLSATAICTSLQFFHSTYSFSLSAILLHHVVFIVPFLRRRSGVQVNAVIIWLFPHDVADEFPCSPSHVPAEISHLNHLKDFIVCDSLLPALSLFLASSLQLHCCSANVFTAVYICPP